MPFTFHWYEGVVPPFDGVAVKVTEDPEAAGFVPAVSAMVTDGATDAFTLMVMLLLAAVVDVAQAEFDVIVQATTAPLVSDVVVKVEAFVPAAVPFTVQAYDGALPPLVGVAVNVIDAPAQVGLEPVVSAILTAGADGVVTVIVIALDVAGLPNTPLWFEVITHVTTSPDAKVEELYVAELVPTFVPFTFHW